MYTLKEIRVYIPKCRNSAPKGGRGSGHSKHGEEGLGEAGSMMQIGPQEPFKRSPWDPFEEGPKDPFTGYTRCKGVYMRFAKVTLDPSEHNTRTCIIHFDKQNRLVKCGI